MGESKSLRFSDGPSLIHEFDRMTWEELDQVFYTEDEIGEMRHYAFMIECGLEEEDWSSGPDVAPLPWPKEKQTSNITIAASKPSPWDDAGDDSDLEEEDLKGPASPKSQTSTVSPPPRLQRTMSMDMNWTESASSSQPAPEVSLVRTPISRRTPTIDTANTAIQDKQDSKKYKISPTLAHTERPKDMQKLGRPKLKATKSADLEHLAQNKTNKEPPRRQLLMRTKSGSGGKKSKKDSPPASEKRKMDKSSSMQQRRSSICVPEASKTEEDAPSRRTLLTRTKSGSRGKKKTPLKDVLGSPESATRKTKKASRRSSSSSSGSIISKTDAVGSPESVTRKTKKASRRESSSSGGSIISKTDVVGSPEGVTRKTKKASRRESSSSSGSIISKRRSSSKLEEEEASCSKKNKKPSRRNSDASINSKDKIKKRRDSMSISERRRMEKGGSFKLKREDSSISRTSERRRSSLKKERKDSMNASERSSTRRQGMEKRVSISKRRGSSQLDRSSHSMLTSSSSGGDSFLSGLDLGSHGSDRSIDTDSDDDSDSDDEIKTKFIKYMDRQPQRESGVKAYTLYNSEDAPGKYVGTALART